MASDLQDPPEVIHEFLRKFEEGYEQVVARVTSRQHVPVVRRILTSAFYTIANRATSNVIPRGVSDFRLLSRTAYLASRKMKERNRFLRGLIAWTGFRTAFVEIERPERFAGDSKFTKIRIGSVIKWSLSAILSHTSAPLIWVAVTGLGLSIASLLATLTLAIIWILVGVPFAGFGTIVGIIMLGFSLTMLAMGIIAQYIALIYDEVKARPIYLVAESTDSSVI
jgi:dolichol-phosphate mannosyltransferase